MATLVRLFGDIDIAEEAVQEAFVVAIDRWPDRGARRARRGWIITTARNKAPSTGSAAKRPAHDRQAQAALCTPRQSHPRRWDR